MTDLMRAHLALERVKVAITQMQSARAEIGVVLDVDNESYKIANAAVEAARDCARACEALIAKLSRAK